MIRLAHTQVLVTQYNPRQSGPPDLSPPSPADSILGSQDDFSFSSKQRNKGQLHSSEAGIFFCPRASGTPVRHHPRYPPLSTIPTNLDRRTYRRHRPQTPYWDLKTISVSPPNKETKASFTPPKLASFFCPRASGTPVRHHPRYPPLSTIPANLDRRTYRRHRPQTPYWDLKTISVSPPNKETKAGFTPPKLASFFARGQYRTRKKWAAGWIDAFTALRQTETVTRLFLSP